MQTSTISTFLVKGKRVKELIANKRKLVEVPYTATLAHTLNALVANNVVAVPVAAPPGHWIGAGGSMILESDKATGAVRKHYIGMVTMLDILHHLAQKDFGGGGGGGGGGDDDFDSLMGVSVSSLIGQSIEGLSLWTLTPNTSVLDCMEVFSKGIHRALVPLESQMEHVVGVELLESSSGYRMLTQMDVISFMKAHETELSDVLSRKVGSLGAVNETIFAVTNHTKVSDAIRCMRNASLNAVPIIDASQLPEGIHNLVNGKGRELVGTFSATDLRGCPIALLQSWLSLSVMEFTEKVAMGPIAESNISSNIGSPLRRVLITCCLNSSLAEVISRAVAGHVHRVWVVDSAGRLVGLVTLTDILGAVRGVILEQT